MSVKFCVLYRNPEADAQNSGWKPCLWTGRNREQDQAQMGGPSGWWPGWVKEEEKMWKPTSFAEWRAYTGWVRGQPRSPLSSTAGQINVKDSTKTQSGKWWIVAANVVPYNRLFSSKIFRKQYFLIFCMLKSALCWHDCAYPPRREMSTSLELIQDPTRRSLK